MLRMGRVIGLVAAVAALVGLSWIAVHVNRSWTSGPTGMPTAESAVTAEPVTPQAFRADDFKFPALMQSLNDGDIRSAARTDEAVFALYYVKEMNEVFGDPEMKVFIDPKCFTQVYDADMNAQLQAMFWTRMLPKALWELASVMGDDHPLGVALTSRYPTMAGMLRQVASDVPDGKLDRLFILGNFPKILQTRARQDALTLFTTYGCASPVTHRIYSNAGVLVKTYRTNH